MGKMKMVSFVMIVLSFCVSTGKVSAEDAEDGEIERLERRLEEPEVKVMEGSAAAQEPGYDWIRPLRWDTDDRRFSLGIKGRIQPRYTYEHRDGERDRSSATLRRLRLDFQGHAIAEDQSLTYRIMPELMGGYSLRDAWINYQFADGHSLRFGQYNIPAFLERSVSSNRHALMERSTANDIFQWPTGGRDIGLMSYGSFGQFNYGVGVFGGEGRNNVGDATSGHLFSARASYSLLGSYPRGFNLVEPVEGTNLTIGAGGYYANNNALSDWNNFTNQTVSRADVTSFAGDVTFQHQFLTSSLQGFYWEVDPRNGADRYYGTGYTVEAGALIIPETLFAAYRHSWANPNRDARQFRQRENMLGLQWYQSGNSAKVMIENGLLEEHDGAGWNRDKIFRIQYQLLF
jgi:hypothetical protein